VDEWRARPIVVSPLHRHDVMSRDHVVVVGVTLDRETQDLEVGALRAAAQAHALARRLDGRVLLVYSRHPEEHYRRAPHTQIWARWRADGAEVDRALERAVARFAEHGVPAALVASDRPAWSAIAGEAERARAEAVVVGKRDTSELFADDRKLGAVALELCRRSTAPVWAVDRRAERPPTTILAAVDLQSEHTDRILHTAARFADLFDAKLHVGHASELEWTEALLEDRPASAQRLGSLAAELERRTRLAIGEAVARRTETHVVTEPPAAGVAALARNVGADLLVMGAARGGNIRAACTAERLYAQVDASLLTIPPLAS
jgi:nucleotide-binding universal stress UspA family protein